MNKIHLIVGGSSVASLVAGAAGGYFFAKKSFYKKLDELVSIEVEATKKHYGVLMTNMQYGQKPDLMDLVSRYPEEEDSDLEIEEDAPVELPQPVDKVLTDYQGFAKEPEVVETNIFTAERTRPLPPRDESGKFLSATAKFKTHKDVEARPSDGEPYPITEQEFMLNDPEHEQDSALYFVKDDTVVLTADYTDVIDNDRIGKLQLERLAEGDREVMYIRHDGLQIDYQVTRTTESLTEAMGLGESEDDFDEIDAAEHRTARADEETELHLQH